MNDRIGVYVCHCGGNISDVVDVKEVVEAIKNEPGVVVAKDYVFMCADAGQKMIEEDIKKHKLNAIVVASCSPKLHEITFRNAVARAGLNPYVFYHANIREHSSWPHSDDPKEATRKAIRHVKAAIAYVRHAEPLEKIKVSSTPAVLVIGGGIAGIRAALDLSEMGVSVYLIEKDPFIGGRTAQLGPVYPHGEKGLEIVKRLIEELKRRDNIVVFTNAELESVSGYIGNFEVVIKVKPRYVLKMPKNLEEVVKACPIEVPDEFNYGLTKRKAIYYPYNGAYPEVPAIDHDNCTKCGECVKICGDCIDLNQKEDTIKVKVGAIILATGFNPYEPKEGEYGYKKYENVVTLPQLIRILELNDWKELKFNGRKVKRLAFIYCIGSRQERKEEEEANEYCSRYCCNATMYLSTVLLEKFPDLEVFHLYRDIRTYGKNEPYYESGCKSGIVFVRYSQSEPPEVVKEGNGILIKVKDLLTGGEMLEIPVDLVVLVVGMVPRENDKLNSILKVPIGRDKFYQEVHPKLRPVETTLTGILIAGTCQGPKDIKETLSSASAAASKAASIAIKKELELEPFVAYVDPDKCNLSKLCINECVYGAIEIKSYGKKGKKAWVNEALCKGCGACVAVCPTEAIQMKGLTNQQIRSMIEVMAKG